MFSKEEYVKILKKQIRDDTYYILEQLYEGRTYKEIAKEIEDKQMFKNICREETVKKYKRKVDESKNLFAKERLKKQRKKKLDNKGIYAICINDEIVYIGKTEASFEHRFKEHLYHLKHQEKDEMYLYKILRAAKEANKNIQLKPLIVLKDLKMGDNLVNNRDLCIMELTLIQLYQPIGNVEGRLTEYKYIPSRNIKTII